MEYNGLVTLSQNYSKNTHYIIILKLLIKSNVSLSVTTLIRESSLYKLKRRILKQIQHTLIFFA